jgi:hypothetical protein
MDAWDAGALYGFKFQLFKFESTKESISIHFKQQRY